MPVSARRLEAKDRGTTPLAQGACSGAATSIEAYSSYFRPLVQETRLFFNSEIEQLVRTHQVRSNSNRPPLSSCQITRSTSSSRISTKQKQERSNVKDNLNHHHFPGLHCVDGSAEYSIVF